MKLFDVGVGALAGAGAALLLGAAVPLTGGNRAAMEQVVHDYILAHPEIIPEAMARGEAREQAKLLAANRRAVETPFAGAYAGAANPDVTVVEFFDYACPYCRASAADVMRLLNEDKHLRVVFRDMPVLGPDSEAAALVSLQAARQGKYRAFYERMYALPGRPDAAHVALAARAAGVTGSATDPAYKAEVQANLDTARALRLTGTPAFVIGNQIIMGAQGYDALTAAVAKARAAKA